MYVYNSIYYVWEGHKNNIGNWVLAINVHCYKVRVLSMLSYIQNGCLW